MSATETTQGSTDVSTFEGYGDIARQGRLLNPFNSDNGRHSFWTDAGTDIHPGDDIAAKSGMDFEVAVTGPLTVSYEGQSLIVPDRRAVIAKDNLQVLGDVGAIYTGVDYRELADTAKAIENEVDGASVVSAGLLRERKQAFAVVTLPNIAVVHAGDELAVSMLLRSSMDGSVAFRGDAIVERLACTNMLSTGQAAGLAKMGWTLRHTTSITDRIGMVRKAVSKTLAYVGDFTAMARRMAAVDVTLAEADALIAELIPDVKNEGQRGAIQRQERVTAERAAIRSNWLFSDTIADDIRRTRWGLLNGITEHFEHGRDLRSDRRVPLREQRFHNVLDGPTARLREQAFRRLSA
jgi:phage/plasmid-like protein (TIGR03299 family)